jgi:hypothetical protein
VPRLRISGAIPPLPHKPSWRAEEEQLYVLAKGNMKKMLGQRLRCVEFVA